MRRVLRALAVPSALLGLASALGVAWGLVRDSEIGDASLQISLARRSPWAEVSFRPWVAGDYRLSLQSVNHTPPFGAHFDGEIEVRLERPDGSPVISRRYRPDDHPRPDNTSFSLLDTFSVETSGPRAWTLAARVIRANEAFAGVRSHVRATREGQDVGMGGLLNYALAIPAFLFSALAAGLWVAGRPKG